MHTHTQTWYVWAYVCTSLSTAAHEAVFFKLYSSSSFLCLAIRTYTFPSSPPLFPFMLPSLTFFSFFLPLPLTLSPSSLSPLCLALSSVDYLALIQNVIKENDQLPQLPLSFLPSVLSSFFQSLSFFLACVTAVKQRKERLCTRLPATQLPAI